MQFKREQKLKTKFLVDVRMRTYSLYELDVVPAVQTDSKPGAGQPFCMKPAGGFVLSLAVNRREGSEPCLMCENHCNSLDFDLCHVSQFCSWCPQRFLTIVVERRWRPPQRQGSFREQVESPVRTLSCKLIVAQSQQEREFCCHAPIANGIFAAECVWPIKIYIYTYIHPGPHMTSSFGLAA